jgi:hypothetical protein
VKVVDTIPPVVTCSVNRSELWPPNHKFVDVGFEFTAVDACDPNSPATMITVTSDEDATAASGSGGKVHCPDATVSAGGEVSLRVERSGAGDGRVYAVRVTATDVCGNAASCEKAVSVPKAQGGSHPAAMDSGQLFDATACGGSSDITRGTGGHGLKKAHGRRD